MKKYIFILVIVFIGLMTFASCTNSLATEGAITSYEQNLTFDNENKTLSGKQIVNYYNYSSDTLTNIKFHLYPNAFRENAKATVVSKANESKAYPNGKSYGKIDIENVSHYNNLLNYNIEGEDNNILNVSLSEPLVSGSTYKLEIVFCTTIPNINHRFGYGANTINCGNYYPIACVYENGDFVTDLYNSNGDPFYSKCSNYNVQITFDENLKIASTGLQTEMQNASVSNNSSSTYDNEVTSNNQNTKTVNIKAKNVRDFAFVLSDKFKTKSETFDGIDVRYYYYSDTNPEKSFEAIKQILEFNKNFSAKYPYDTYSVAESNFVHGGMEYPQLVLISDDLDDHDTYINVIVHETCHQWWYGVVGNNEYSYGWIDEGLTDFNTAIFYDAYPSYNLQSSTIMKNAEKSYQKFVKVYSDIYTSLNTSMNRKLNEFPTEYEYVYCTYTKGMLLFNSLKEMLGEKKFNSAIKLMYNTYAYKEINDKQLIKCFEKATSRNLESYIDSWINGKVQILAS